jgi:hypothetical protein
MVLVTYRRRVHQAMTTALLGGKPVLGPAPRPPGLVRLSLVDPYRTGPATRLEPPAQRLASELAAIER